MKIDIITLFPKMFKGPFEESIIKRAQEKGLVEICIHDLRKWSKDKRKTIDDRPFGGGVGMIIMVEPIYEALKKIKSKKYKREKIILLTPQGSKLNQEKVRSFSKLDHLILIAGHYEGFDERIRESLVDEEISIGDYILTGGEIPAMVLVDSITRLIPNVLEKAEATKFESFSSEGLLEYPQYTRPFDFKGHKVPQILISGDHKKIEEWRKEKSIEKTNKTRPELLDKTK